MRMVIGFPAGGSPDLVGRLIAERLSTRLGKPIIVESAVGGGGVRASEIVATSPPDGYTMVMLTGAHSSTAATRRSLPYHPTNDFSFLSMITAYPMMIVTTPSSPITSLADLIARAKAAPDGITYASNAPGSVHHLLGEWINIEAGTTMTAVAYRGAAEATTDLIGGRVDVMIDTATTAIPLVRAGRTKALAVASPNRYPLLPETPTVAETLPGVVSMSWLGLAMPPRTPQPILQRVQTELSAILETADMRERLAQLGGIPNPTSGEAMREQITREIDRWNRVVDQKNIERQ